MSVPESSNLRCEKECYRLNARSPHQSSRESDRLEEHTEKGAQPQASARLIKTRLEGREAVPLALYFLVIAALGIPLCANILITEPSPDWLTGVLFLCIGLISFHLPVVMPSDVQIHPGSPIVLGALFRYGMPTALITIIPSFLLHFFTWKHGLLNCLFNAGQLTICLSAAKFVGILTGWQQGMPARDPDLIPIILMKSAFDVVNIFLVSISRSIDNTEPWRKSFMQMFYNERRSSFMLEMFLCIVSMLISSYLGYSAPIIILVGVLALRLQNIFEKELVVRTYEAETDQLTKLYNLRYVEKWLENDFSLLARNRKSCSFIFADVDGLKAINDAYGHEAGDYLLAHVAKVISSNIRSKDWVARYGGDEFVIACPDANTEQAVSIANRIINATKENRFFYNGLLVGFGLSFGVATWPKHGETGFDIIRMADKAMYLAKKEGGNCVRTADEL